MDYLATIWAGLLGGGVMTIILYLLGSMMVKQKVMAYMAGAMIHAMMSIAFGTFLFRATDWRTEIERS